MEKIFLKIDKILSCLDTRKIQKGKTHREISNCFRDNQSRKGRTEAKRRPKHEQVQRGRSLAQEKKNGTRQCANRQLSHDNCKHGCRKRPRRIPQHHKSRTTPDGGLTVKDSSGSSSHIKMQVPDVEILDPPTGLASTIVNLWRTFVTYFSFGSHNNFFVWFQTTCIHRICLAGPMSFIAKDFLRVFFKLSIFFGSCPTINMSLMYSSRMRKSPPSNFFTNTQW